MNIKSLKNILPETSKAEVKKILKFVRLYDERLSMIGINRLFKDDIFIVSYPKSGNTWVRFTIANIIAPDETINFRNIEKYIPDIYKSTREHIDSLNRPRFIKSHAPIYHCFPKIIYIYRDGRDALLSYYHYETQAGRFTGTLTEFIQNEAAKRVGYWHDHVSQALDYADKYPKRILLLQYEAMLQSPLKAAFQIANFCQISTDANLIEAAVNNCSFHKLKEMEKKYGPENEDMKSVKFFRYGQSGQWQTEFSKTDINCFMSLSGDTLKRLGYIN